MKYWVVILISFLSIEINAQNSRGYLFNSELKLNKVVTYKYNIQSEDTSYYELQDIWLRLVNDDTFLMSKVYRSDSVLVAKSEEIITKKGLRLVKMDYYELESNKNSKINVKLGRGISYPFKSIEKIKSINRIYKMKFFTIVDWGERFGKRKTLTKKTNNLKYIETQDKGLTFEKKSKFKYTSGNLKFVTRNKYILIFNKNIGLVEYTLVDNGKVTYGKLEEVIIK